MEMSSAPIAAGRLERGLNKQRYIQFIRERCRKIPPFPDGREEDRRTNQPPGSSRLFQKFRPFGGRSPEGHNGIERGLNGSVGLQRKRPRRPGDCHRHGAVLSRDCTVSGAEQGGSGAIPTSAKKLVVLNVTLPRRNKEPRRFGDGLGGEDTRFILLQLELEKFGVVLPPWVRNLDRSLPSDRYLDRLLIKSPG